MKTNIIGRQLTVYDDTKKLIEEKLAKLDKYFGGEGEATATLSHKRNVATLEITVKVNGTIFRSEVDAPSFRDALDKSIDNIERQIRKNKTKLKKKLREGLTLPVEVEELEPVKEPETLIMREKTFKLNPMTAEEAAMQMTLLEHSFFVYLDVDKNKTCVVYRRYDGNYGVIIPE